jgi:hypothetical protein
LRDLPLKKLVIDNFDIDSNRAFQKQLPDTVQLKMRGVVGDEKDVNLLLDAPTH